MSVVAILVFGQVSTPLNQRFTPNFARDTLLRFGIKESSQVILGSYKGNQFYYVKKVGAGAFQLSYHPNTDTFSLGSGEPGHAVPALQRIPLKRLKLLAEKELASKTVRGFMSTHSVKQLKAVDRNEPENPLITFGWQSIVNGYPAGYEGDHVRVTLSRASGKLVSLAMRRNTEYRNVKPKLGLQKATEIANKVMGRTEAKSGDIWGELRYHLFPDEDSRAYWKSTKKIRLRLGYFYSDSSQRSCFVDAETGFVDPM